MKKIILLASLLFCGLTQAQISVTTDGEEIMNGDIFTFNVLTTDAKLPLLATNTSGAPIALKIRVDEMYNTPGNEVQLCFGDLCYFNIAQGNAYPNDAVVLQPGGTSNINDHFWNANPGNGEDDIHYKLTFVRVDEAGAPVEDLLSFYYLYRPTMGTNDFAALKNMGVALTGTVVNNLLEMDTQQPLKLEIFNINGQLVKSASVASGLQSVDVSALNSAVYIARFTNDSNQVSQIRIVKN